MQKNKLVSIICAVHNEESGIKIFYDRIIGQINELPYNFEIIFTNNRSTDNTLSIIKELGDVDARVKVLTFSRNFGYQSSVLAGMTHARGDSIITIDVDCEDPPEMIPKFLSKWEEGFDVVYGIRMNRPESRILIMFRNLFYRVLKFTADAEIILNMAEFGLIASYVRDSIIDNNNTFPFLRSEISYSGFNKFGIPYDRRTRASGKTHYNFFSMAVFAIGGILTSSTFPFRLSVFIFPIFLLFNLFFYFMFSVTETLILVDLLYLILLISTHGIYLARIYKNVLGRPIYIIDWKLSSIDLRISKN